MRTYNYKVNKEKGVVTCVLTVENRILSEAFVGIARCSKEDTFDEDFGKTIARQRAVLKANKKELKNFESMFSESYLSETEKTIKQIRSRKEALRNNIGKLVAEIEDNLNLIDEQEY